MNTRTTTLAVAAAVALAALTSSAQGQVVAAPVGGVIAMYPPPATCSPMTFTGGEFATSWCVLQPKPLLANNRRAVRG
jgi:hypothetical protein